jgi:hypothetical protein
VGPESAERDFHVQDIARYRAGTFDLAKYPHLGEIYPRSDDSTGFDGGSD